MELAKKIGLAFFSLALTLGLLEISLRVLNLFTPPGEGHPTMLTSYGWRTVPNLTSLNRDLHGEYSLIVRSNGFGMNEDDITLEKPAGTRRVAFFGDSYTEAHQVSRPDNFVERAEARLKELTRAPIQTLNFGMSGYGPDLCYLRYLHQGSAFSPDIVVMVDLVENDAHDVTKEAYPRWQKPYYDVDADTWVLPEPVPYGITFGVDPKSRRWYRKSYVYTMKREATVRIRSWFQERFGKIGKTPLPFHWQMMIVPTNDYWEKAWKTTERIIQRFRDDVEQNGGRFVIVVMPSRFEIHPEYWEMVKKRHRIEGNVDVSYPRKRIMEIAARLNLKTIDLYPAMKAAAERGDQLYLRYDGHLTAAGHRVAAEDISRSLSDILSSATLGHPVRRQTAPSL